MDISYHYPLRTLLLSFFWSLLLLPSSIVTAQEGNVTIVSGELYDVHTGQSVPYATISTKTLQGLVGSVSDDNGLFTLSVRQEQVLHCKLPV